MFKFSVLFMSLLVVCDRSSGFRSFQSRLEVQNGLHWGSWGEIEMCPVGMYAAGFSLRVDPASEPVLFIFGDDETAVNGIRLHCVYPSTDLSASSKSYATVQSNTGSWGEWTDIEWCSSGFLTSFQLRADVDHWFWDVTAVNNIRFTCSNGQTLEGSGTSYGNWGDWSNKCYGKGICGLDTRVEEPQGIEDDTALTDVDMYCCD